MDESIQVDIESDVAENALPLLVNQARIPIIYLLNEIRGIQLNAVRGRFNPQEALQLLVADTDLAIELDQKSGTWLVKKSKENKGNAGDAETWNGQDPNVLEPTKKDNKRKKRPKKTNTDTVYELSPFVINSSQDNGYRSTNSLTGSRLNTKLADSASSVSVFTRKFIEDTGVVDLQEIARYSVGSVNDTQEITANPYINNYVSGANAVRRIRVRGIRATKGTNYFESLIPDDAYRAERYDESRGPNGILFGISNPGGIINTSTLKASTDQDSGKVKYSAGSYDRSRLEVQFNKVLIDRVLGVTLAGLTQDNAGWREFESDKRDRIYGAVTWKPTDRIMLQAMGETGNHRLVTVRPFNATDEFLAWYRNRELLGLEAVTGRPGIDGNNPSDNLQALGVTGTLTNSNNTRYIYLANDDSYFDGAGTWTSGSYDDKDVASEPGSLVESGVEARNPAKLLSAPDFPYPLHLNASGPGMFRDTDFAMYTFTADFKISGSFYLNLEHGYQRAEIDARYLAGAEPALRGDPNLTQRHPDKDKRAPGALNPYAGQLYFDANWRKDDHAAESSETRLALSYDFDAAPIGWERLGSHRFSAGLARRSVSDTLVQKRWGFLGNPFHPRTFDHANNRIAVRNYITEGDFTTYLAATPPTGQTELLDDEGVTRQIGWVHSSRGSANSHADQNIDSIIAALQSRFWKGKLVSTVGYREDQADSVSLGHTIDPIFGDTLTADTAAPDYRKSKPIKANTKTAGLVYHATPSVSLLANYATSIGLPEFRNRVLPNAELAMPIMGEGKDLGVSFSLLKNRLSGRLVYFETSERNRTTNGGITRILRDPNIDSMDSLSQVFEALRKPDGAPYSEAEWEQVYKELTPDYNAVLQDNESQGVELSIKANITSNWRLALNASKTDRIMSHYGREAIKWLGWQKDEDDRLINGISFVDDATELGRWDIDRNAYVPGSPLDRILEIAENAVGWDASTLITSNNDESIAETHFLQAQELQEQIDIREKRWGVSPYKFNVFSVYDFTEGRLNGFTFGGGFRWTSGDIIGEDLNGKELKAPSEPFVDLLLKYRPRPKKNSRHFNYQLNVYNLLNNTEVIPVRYSVPTDPNSPESRYKLTEPITVRATVTYTF